MDVDNHIVPNMMYNSGNTFRTFLKDSDKSKYSLMSDHHIMSETINNITYIPITQCEVDYPNYLSHIINDKYCEYSMNKNNDWDIVEYLKDNCIKSYEVETTHHHSGGFVRKTNYEIPIIEWISINNEDSNNKTYDEIYSEIYANYKSSSELYRENNRKHSATQNVIYCPNLNHNNFNVYRFDDFGKIVFAFKYSYPDLPPNIIPIDFLISSNVDTVNICNASKAKIPNVRVWDDDNKSMVLNFHPNIQYWGNYHNYWCPIDNDKNDSCILIDMYKNTDVKFLSIMGRPKNIDRYRCRDKHNNTISVPVISNWDLSENNVIINYNNTQHHNIQNHYVKRVSIFGRVEGKKWVGLGDYQANSDRFTEKLIDITHNMPKGFMPRYLKIVPLEYEGSKSMAVMIYVKNTNDTTKARNDIANNMMIYTISERIRENLASDGHGYRNRRSWHSDGDLTRDEVHNRKTDEALREYVKNHGVQHNIICDEYM